MAIGFVLINSAPGREGKVYQELLKHASSIEYLYPLFGEYDLIAKVEAPDFKALNKFVRENITDLAGVVDTTMLTCCKILEVP